jgi:hypothetical protein
VSRQELDGYAVLADRLVALAAVPRKGRPQRAAALTPARKQPSDPVSAPRADHLLVPSSAFPQHANILLISRKGPGRMKSAVADFAPSSASAITTLWPDRGRGPRCFNGLPYHCGFPQIEIVCQQIRGHSVRVLLEPAACLELGGGRRHSIDRNPPLVFDRGDKPGGIRVTRMGGHGKAEF